MSNPFGALFFLGACAVCGCAHRPGTLIVSDGTELICRTRAVLPEAPPELLDNEPAAEPGEPVEPTPEGPGQTSGGTDPTPAPALAIDVIAGESAPIWDVVRVARCEGTNAVVLHPDGRVEAIAATRLRRPALARGTKVVVQWGTDRQPYPATVVDSRPDLVRVSYEDSSEEWVELERLFRVHGAQPAPAAGANACRIDAGRVPAMLVEKGTLLRTAPVIECGGGTVVLRDPNGSTRTVPEGSVQRPIVRVGDEIQVLWRDGEEYPATVRTVGATTIGVRYEDGSEEEVSRGQLLGLLSASGLANTEPFRCENARGARAFFGLGSVGRERSHGSGRLLAILDR